MRLFVAVLLEELIKDCLCDVIEEMRPYAVRGNFSRRENLHLTLAFLGETDRLDAAKQAIHRITGHSFSVQLNQLGRFRGRGGDLYWAGFEKSTELFSLQKNLVEQLADVGLVLEKRKYSPHLTLGRQIQFERGADIQRFQKVLRPLNMKVNKISLMSSERIQGRLTYTELDSQTLQ